MFGGRRRALEAQAETDLRAGFAELLKRYDTLAYNYYCAPSQPLNLPHLPDATASELRMHSFTAALARRAALEELMASPRTFTYGDARQYATTGMIQSLLPVLDEDARQVLWLAEERQVLAFLRDPRYGAITRWTLQGKV